MNRAKCLVCKDILQSTGYEDIVTCSCSRLSVRGVDEDFEFKFENHNQFCLVDDQGNELHAKDSQQSTEKESGSSKPLSSKTKRKEKLQMLKTMINNIESLPSHAMTLPINHFDFVSSLILLLSILVDEEDLKEEI